MRKKNEELSGGFYWKGLKEAKEIGMTAEEFEHVGILEGSITDLEQKIEECKEKIRLTKKGAKERRKEILLQQTNEI